MARRRFLFFGLIGSLLGIGALLWWTSRSVPSLDSSTSANGASSSQLGGEELTSGGSVSSYAPPVEQIPMMGCWKGLLDFDKHLSLETFRAALASALSANDPRLAAYLQERLIDLVGDDPQKALEVVKWAEASAPPALNVYMEALKQTPAVQQGAVSERLLKLGESKTASLENRSAAIDALETQRRLSPQALARLTAVALDETVDSTAWMATRTLGRIMKEDFKRTGKFEPYWNELLHIGERSRESAVRVLALEMPSYSDPLLDRGSIDRLANVLNTDPEREVREMAAFRLAVTRDPQRALEVYQTAFQHEQDLCVRWAIFRFAVRAAGAEALRVLAQFAAFDERFQQDYLDFKQLYGSGTVDFSRIWFDKQERHSCPGGEEESGG